MYTARLCRLVWVDLGYDIEHVKTGWGVSLNKPLHTGNTGLLSATSVLLQYTARTKKITPVTRNATIQNSDSSSITYLKNHFRFVPIGQGIMGDIVSSRPPIREDPHASVPPRQAKHSCGPYQSSSYRCHSCIVFGMDHFTSRRSTSYERVVRDSRMKS
jgi:hypothetical protein